MVNNEFYKDLGGKWFDSEGDVIALLRQENLAKLPWVREQIAREPQGGGCSILDAGCGGGFLTHALAGDGHRLTGLDISDGVIAAAQSHDVNRRCEWVVSPIENMPFADGCFDVVCAMDVLEHVEDYARVITECLRVLKPDGRLLLHTFNRTWLAWLFADKGVEWFIRGTPEHLHDWKYFVKPEEIECALAGKGFEIVDLKGIGPRILSKAFAELLFTRRVPKVLRFSLGKRVGLGYLAAAKLKRNS